jgi:hypothetical protein
MATQDFINGGFYGKVGQLIGRRNGNTRVLYPYFIPKDPKTPAQLAHRALVAHAVALAHIAYNTNKGDPSWATAGRNEWSQRVGTATRRLQNGESDADAIPLYPDGYIDVLYFTNVEVVYSADFSNFTLSADGPIVDYVRHMRFSIRVYSEATSDWFDDVVDFDIPSGQALNFVYDMSRTNYARASQSFIIGASFDDAAGNPSSELSEVSLSPSNYPAHSITLVDCDIDTQPSSSVWTFVMWQDGAPQAPDSLCTGTVLLPNLTLERLADGATALVSVTASFSYDDYLVHCQFTSPFAVDDECDIFIPDQSWGPSSPDNILLDTWELSVRFNNSE